jgi:hypothetical protein
VFKSKFGKYLIWFSTLLVVMALSLTLTSTSAAANLGLSLTPFESIKVDVAPGETITHQMRLQLGEQDQAMDIAVDVMGFGVSTEGAIQAITAEEDTSPYSARSFITVNNSLFHLDPGKSQDITATISVPSDVGEGGRYAIIYIHQQQPAGSGSTGSISAFNIPVLLTVKGSTPVHTGKITSLITGEVVSGEAVDIFTMFQNTGNHHYKVKGVAIVKNAEGQTLDTIYVPVTDSPVLPGTLRELKATFIPKGELATEDYTISSEVMLEDGSLLDEASSTLKVETPYTPPPAASDIKLTPSSASTLETEDGRISINFPQGAAVAPVDVSLRNYPVDQIPSTPSYINPTSTCFRVDGLIGVLAKQATVTVKYTNSDLGKAGGDASRLRLALWDEGNSRWTLLKTNVDAGAMILSASSNQMGTWAIVVVGPVTSEVKWAILVVVAAGVLFALTVILFLGRKRRRSKLAR